MTDKQRKTIGWIKGLKKENFLSGTLRNIAKYITKMYPLEDTTHDQHFVDSVLNLMLEDKDSHTKAHTVMGSDNCSV